MNRPRGYRTLGRTEAIRFGDIWLRPTDGTWIEVGTAMVGILVFDLTVAAARKNELSSPRLELLASK